MPKIQNALERFVKFIFKAVEATTSLGLRLWSILTRVYDFFVKLDKATDGWSTVILGVIAAWRLLNLEFLATPLGMIIAGLVAILALFDDFETWQEGGQSLFNWAPFVPVIHAVEGAMKSLYTVLESIGEVLGALASAFVQLFHGDFTGFFDGLKGAASAVLDIFTRLWESIKGIGGAIGAIGQFAGGLFGNGNVAANLGNNPVVGPLQNPIGSGQNALTNQHVQQQTSITVTGNADANSVGKAVANEQNRVNFDMARNMKGATR
jgi:phage-related protein